MSARDVLGAAPGQPYLTAQGPGVALTPGGNAIPELDAAADAPRPLWRHPAFLVSMILTVLALAAAAVLIAMSLLGGGRDTVTGAGIEIAGGNAHLTWTSDAPVDLFVVTGGEALDVSQLITGREEAWVPAALGLYESTSCFVVRPTGLGEADVVLDADALADQGAASACVRDATGG